MKFIWSGRFNRIGSQLLRPLLFSAPAFSQCICDNEIGVVLPLRGTTEKLMRDKMSCAVISTILFGVNSDGKAMREHRLREKEKTTDD